MKNFVLKKNPFDGYKIPSAQRREMDISDSTLDYLLNLKREDTTPGRFTYLQIWRLQFYCNGMNLIDLLRLKRENFLGDEIQFRRHKTEDKAGRLICIPVTPAVKKAFDIVGTGKVHILPYLDGIEQNTEAEIIAVDGLAKNINAALRNICKASGITEKVTTYTARHSFATRLLRAGVPVEFISMALGHSSITTTQHYLEGFSQEQRLQVAELLIGGKS